MTKICLGEVTTEFNTNGELTPRSFVWENQHIAIERVLDIMPMSYLKSGVTGKRYTCQLDGRRVILFFDDERWYIEKN